MAVVLASPKLALVVLKGEVERGRGSSLAATAARGLRCETVRSSHTSQVKGGVRGARSASGRDMCDTAVVAWCAKRAAEFGTERAARPPSRPHE